MNCLEYQITCTMNRMAASTVYHFAARIPTSAKQLRGVYYTGGPVCLVIVLPTGLSASVIERDFIGTFQRLSDRRIMNLEIGLY